MKRSIEAMPANSGRVRQISAIDRHAVALAQQQHDGQGVADERDGDGELLRWSGDPALLGEAVESAFQTNTTGLPIGRPQARCTWLKASASPMWKCRYAM